VVKDEEGIPLKRGGTTEDVLMLVCFASDMSNNQDK
jgi:hypothetical protein